jgi:hypothetical protein
MVILIIKCTDVVCRVPYIVLSHRLSILYLRTCVGLGYGNKKKNFFQYCFLGPIKFGLSTVHSSAAAIAATLEAVLTHSCRTFLWNPLSFGGKHYSFLLRYSCQHYLFDYVHKMKHFTSTISNAPLLNLNLFFFYRGRKNKFKGHSIGKWSKTR